jgi:hypothetical protein
MHLLKEKAGSSPIHEEDLCSSTVVCYQKTGLQATQSLSEIHVSADILGTLWNNPA